MSRASSIPARTVLRSINATPRSNADQRRAKGYAGELLELALGARAGSQALPDFPRLGIELKTIPLDARGQPSESTFVCGLPLRDMAELQWEGSMVQRRLRRVLWIPIESAIQPLGARRVGAPRMWSPNARELEALRCDFELLASRLGSDPGAPVSARIGRVLQLRPKAAHAGVHGVTHDVDGVPVRARPLGFYLRRTFTARIFAAP